MKRVLCNHLDVWGYGRFFRRNGGSSPEYSPLIEPSSSNDEGTVLNTPRSVVQLITQGILRIPHPSTPPPPPPPLHTPTPSPPSPPLPQFNMSNVMKMLIFKGVGSKGPKQFWFVAGVVWTTQQIMDDSIKKEKLVTALQDRALTWYIKYCTNNPTATLVETQ